MKPESITAGIAEARSSLSKLIAKAEKGARVVITRRGSEIVELVPVTDRDKERRHQELLRRREIISATRQFAARVRSHMALEKERHKRARTAQQSERRLRQVLESASEGVLEVDKDGKILLCNRAAERMFGYTREEFKHLHIPDLVPEDIRAVHAMYREEFTKRPVTRPMALGKDLRARRKDGTLFPVEIGLSPNMGDGMLKVIAVVHDVSARRAAEEALRQSREKLRQAEKLEALARMAGGTAHEFNNLLTMVMGYAALMLSSLESPDALIDYIEKITKASKRAAELTRQLLAFSHRQMLAPEIIDLNQVLAEVRQILPSLIGKDIRPTLTFNLMPALIRADRAQIHQVIVNLVLNAQDAMPEGGDLIIGVESRQIQPEELHDHPGLAPGEYVQLNVTDTGVGMSPHVQRRIFEPFFSTKGLGQGTGLSLAAIYGIVQQSGGSITTQSESGRGTTFEILFPRVTQTDAIPDSVPATLPVALRGGETILLVEDEDTLRALTREFLQSLGYNVLEAAHGEDAMRLAAEYPGEIDLLLTDIVMPGMTGREVARQIVPLRPEMKVLYVSGFVDEQFAGEGVTDPNEKYLEKPYAFEELAEKIREMLETASPGKADDAVVN